MGSHFRKYPLITIKLFQTLVQPILLYGSDFWGTLKLPRNNPIEIFHMKFSKELSGVATQTTNSGVLLELGQMSISLLGKKQAFKNWSRISNENKCNNLVKISYNVSSNLTWQRQIKNTLSSIGMLDKFLNNKDNLTHAAAYKRMCDIFHQITLHDI